MNYCFHIKENYDIEVAWEMLEEAGATLLYSLDSVEEQEKLIVATIHHSEDVGTFSKIECVGKVAVEKLSEIDWDYQWELHGLGYKEGYVHLDLNKFDPSHHALIKLCPGPGFGDLSHMTTRLMLKLMGPLVKGRHILDVGCGSGVLSLAAAAMGAASVQGIDIDPLAVSHSRANSQLNDFKEILFSLPEDYVLSPEIDSLVVLMNMIDREQRVAWTSLKSIHHQIKACVLSGILVEEKETYLQRWLQEGWFLVKELKEGEWASFHLERGSHFLS